MLRRMPFYWYTTLCYLHGGFLPRQILPGGFCAADFFRGGFLPRQILRGGFLPRFQVAICHYTSDVIGVICRIWGAVIQLAMPPWLCFKCLFTLPVSCVMFQQLVNKSTPKFCTPSRDNNCINTLIMACLPTRMSVYFTDTGMNITEGLPVCHRHAT